MLQFQSKMWTRSLVCRWNSLRKHSNPAQISAAKTHTECLQARAEYKQPVCIVYWICSLHASGNLQSQSQTSITYNSLVFILTIFWLNCWACLMSPRDSRVSGSSLSFSTVSGTRTWKTKPRCAEPLLMGYSTQEGRTFISGRAPALWSEIGIAEPSKRRTLKASSLLQLLTLF